MDANFYPSNSKLSFLRLLAALLLFATPAVAQRTVVSGTVKDVSGIPYAGGTLVATLSLPVGVSGATLNGVQIGGSTQRVTLDTTGSFLMQLPDNNVVQPPGTQWTFAVNISPGAPPPLGTGPQNCSATLTITGSSQSVNSSFSACPALSSLTLPANTPIPINQAQGPRFNARQYGAIGDAKKAFRTVVTNGSAHITDVLDFNPWAALDVGKKLFAIDVGSGQTGQNPLNLAIATITVFNSATDISVNTTGNGFAQSGTPVVWYTQDDTAAFIAAGVAAGTTIATANFKGFSEYTYPGSVYCPEGGYVVSGVVLDQQGGNPYSLGVSFIGAGRAACRFYPIPGVTATHSAWFMSLVQTGGQTISGFSVDCGFGLHALGVAMFNFNSLVHATIRDIEDDSCGDTGANAGIFAFNQGSDIIFDLITANGTSLGSAQTTFLFSGISGVVHARNISTTNPGNIPLQISSSGGTTGSANIGGCNRSAVSTQIVFEESVFDEGGNPVAVSVGAGSCVNFKGVGMFAGGTAVLSVDGTSGVYLDSSNLTSFGGGCSGGNRQGIIIASGGYVYATGTTIAGCGSNGAGLSAAVSGPAGATFVSAGGNNILNCQGVLPCPLVTAANFATLGFNGGIVPKSSETHTPNTCYAVTGNLLATAQNLCSFLNDQNYQLLNITAQSGGTTPANSACATPPVITLSDGTRSATMTMTSGKTSWSSAVDAVTNINQIFASGATMTISIGANTCATPPVNVAVSYVVQSAINP